MMGWLRCRRWLMEQEALWRWIDWLPLHSEYGWLAVQTAAFLLAVVMLVIWRGPVSLYLLIAGQMGWGLMIPVVSGLWVPSGPWGEGIGSVAGIVIFFEPACGLVLVTAITITAFWHGRFRFAATASALWLLMLISDLLAMQTLAAFAAAILAIGRA